jgi:hypothetical protein
MGTRETTDHPTNRPTDHRPNKNKNKNNYCTVPKEERTWAPNKWEAKLLRLEKQFMVWPFLVFDSIVVDARLFLMALSRSTQDLSLSRTIT